MLPSSLLAARRWRNRIYPVYAKTTRENIELSQRLIQLYEENIGKKKSILKESLSELEDQGYNFRFVRGLSLLLDRRCVYSTSIKIDPLTIRRLVFKKANEMGLPTSLEQRLSIIQKASIEMKVEVDKLEDSFYADLEDELKLKKLDYIEPEKLIKHYNLSLTQTLLFNSSETRFKTSGNWQRIFRAIKRLGLIYEVQRTGNELWVKLDGPISLFKLNSRYGNNMAKILPFIIANKKWRIESKILRRNENRLLNLELDSLKYGALLETSSESEHDAYDSQIEKDFAIHFKAVNTGWQLIREPEPVPTGKYVMIPDFLFKKSGVKVYMEVVGFWTQDYLKRKIEKLEMIKGLDMMIAVDEELACHKIDKVAEKHYIFYFKNRVPLKPVLTYLKDVEQSIKETQIGIIGDAPINLVKPIVSIKELAERLGVLVEVVKEILEKKQVLGYVQLSDILIKESKLKEIDEKLKERLRVGKLSLDKASRLIEKMGGRNPVSLLEALDYTIDWRGLDAKNALIKEKRK